MKKSTSSMLLLGFLALISGACQQAEAIDANAVPNIVGSVNTTNVTNGNTLTTTVNGGTGAVGQNDMTGGLGSAATWNINASAHSQTFLGRFVDGKLTEINGKIQTGCASGMGCGYGDTLKVILTNPYGITFGNGSAVNANSFTAATFNPVGAKDLKNMTAAQLDAYRSDINAKFGPNAQITFQGGSATNGAKITLNNSQWDVNKSAAIVAKDIDIYNGSKIATSLKYNYGSPANQNFSNVKLVTSDGVNFTYKANGYLDNGSAQVLNGKAGVDYTLNIGHKDSANALDATISSGSVHAINKGTTDASKTKVGKAAIKGHKLVNSAFGDIYLVGDSVEVDNSLIATYNTSESGNTSINTYNKVGGQITIGANKNIDVNSSTLETAYSNSTNTSELRGDVTLNAAKGNINVDGSTVNSEGDVHVIAQKGNANINDSIVQGKNQYGGPAKDVTIYGGNNVNITDSNVIAQKDLQVLATNDANLTNNGKIYAGEDIKIVAKDTLIDDSALSYNDLVLHDGVNNNNVTIKDNTTLQDRDSTDGITIDVKGNLTFDHATVKTKTPGNNSTLKNQDKIVANATGDVNVVNNSNITTVNDLNINAGNDVNVNESALTSENGANNIIASNDVKVKTSTVTAKKANTADAGNNVVVEGLNGFISKDAANNITAKNNIKADGTKFTAKTDNKLETQNGNIIVDDTTMTAQAGDNLIAAAASVDIDGSTLNAKNNNQVSANTDIDITTSNITAQTGNNTVVAQNNVTMKNDAVKATAGDNKISANNDVDIECVEATAKKDNNLIASTGKVDVKSSKLKADNENKVTAKKDIKTQSVEITAKANTVKSTGGNIDAVNTKINATANNNIVAKNVTFSYDSTATGACTGANCVNVDESSITGAANDIKATTGNVDIEDTKVTATDGDNNIETPKGSIKLKDVEVKAEDGDNNIVANVDVDTECATLDADNNNVVATTGKVNMKTTLAKATNSNNVTAKKNVSTTSVEMKAKNNTVVSKTGNINAVNTKLDASVKNKVEATVGNVTFDYDEAVASACIGTGCPTVNESTLKAPENEITAGEDIDIDANLQPDDPTKPEDTKTTLTAKNVTTGAKVIYDSLYDKVGHIVGDGELNTNGTKLEINTPGDINLVLKNTNNPKAGLDLKGNKVEIKTRDGELSISKIYANDLYLSKDEKFIAGETVITPTEKAIDSFAGSNPDELKTQAGFDAELPGRGYIEVDHGFNFDYEPSSVSVGGMYQGSFNELHDADGNPIGYGKHYITLDENTTQGEFLLTYAKPFACDPAPIVDPDVAPTVYGDSNYMADQTALTRIPLQSDMVGDSNAINNGVTDPSISMIAAAAAVDVDDDDQLDY